MHLSSFVRVLQQNIQYMMASTIETIILSLPPALRRRQAIKERDIPAEIDRGPVELSPPRPSSLASPSKRHGSHGTPLLSRHGPDAPATVHQHVPAMVWGPVCRVWVHLIVN